LLLIENKLILKRNVCECFYQLCVSQAAITEGRMRIAVYSSQTNTSKTKWQCLLLVFGLG